jgi:hypothetical protein
MLCVLAASLTTTADAFLNACGVGYGAWEAIFKPTVQQLLSSPAALTVALRIGLSAEMQEGARAGRTAPLACVHAVSRLFSRSATSVCELRQAPEMPGCAKDAEVEEKLAAFLGLEENLPFLEPLCHWSSAGVLVWN